MLINSPFTFHYRAQKFTIFIHFGISPSSLLGHTTLVSPSSLLGHGHSRWHSSRWPVRRRNTRYKNPQLVAQHCFVASFRRCFPFFTLRCGLKKCSALIGWFARARANLFRDKLWVMKNEQQSQKLFFKVDPQLSSTHNKCFCCATSWSHKVKNGKHRRKLATKQCCATSWGFMYLVFRRL